VDSLPFSEHAQGGALYVTALGASFVLITYAESQHALWRGCVAGAIGGAILVGIWILVRTRRNFE
jgi:hypothetical protein